MAPVFNKIQVVPTGGAATLLFNTAPSGQITLARAASGSGGIGAFTQLYSGSPLTSGGVNQFVLDYGDFLQSPLVSGTTYVYQLTDVGGSILSPGILTPSAFTLEADSNTQILTRLLQAAIDNNTPPPGVKPGRVLQAMPLAGLPLLPSVVITPEILGQEYQKIGDDVELPDVTNTWAMEEQARWLYRVSVIASSAVERDYYRNLIIAVFKIVHAYVFAPIGENVTHNYQAASYQVVDPQKGMTPGFYGCDVMLEMVGTFNLSITTSYGVISTITANVSGGIAGVSPQASISVQVPVSG